MCPVRVGSPKLIPCCLCDNWCHVLCSYQTYLGRICPCHIRILDPKRKIMVMSRPYMEEYVVLPTRAAVRAESRLAERDMGYKLSWNDKTASRWCSATWINILVEKLAWLSAGLTWMPSASDTGKKAEYSNPQSEEPQPLPTVNLFELWEDGSQQAKAVSGHEFHYPMCFALSCPWNFCNKAISLRDAVEGAANNSGCATKLDGVANNSLSPGIHFPNQPSLSKGPTESNSLTYWWGATLCRPEMNDVSLAETVVIAMRIAAMREMRMNIEVNKLTLQTMRERSCLRIHG